MSLDASFLFLVRGFRFRVLLRVVWLGWAKGGLGFHIPPVPETMLMMMGFAIGAVPEYCCN